MLSAVPGHSAAQDSELLVSYCHFCVGVHVLGRGGPALGCRVPPESYVEAITSSGIVLGGGPLGGNQVSMRSGGRGPRDGMGALRRRHARDLAHSLCHLQARKRVLTRNSTDRHLELELPTSGTMRIRSC